MNRIGVMSLLLITLFMSGCEDKKMLGEILDGEHKLHKMVESVKINSNLSGGFFLVAGGIDQSTTEEIIIRFSWQMNDDTYAISSLPIEKIRINLDNEVTIPTIKFNWSYKIVDFTDTQEIIDYCVDSAVVTVKPDDWPIQINLPLNG